MHTCIEWVNYSRLMASEQFFSHIITRKSYCWRDDDVSNKLHVGWSLISHCNNNMNVYIMLLNKDALSCFQVNQSHFNYSLIMSGQQKSTWFNLTWLYVYKTSNLSFVLILPNHPIRMMYILDTVSRLAVFRIRVQNHYWKVL